MGGGYQVLGMTGKGGGAKSGVGKEFLPDLGT